MDTLLLWLFWNPNREAFTVPIIDRPVAWYGILFASGFACCYLLMIYIMKHQIWRRGLVTSEWIKDWPKFLSQIRENPLRSRIDAPLDLDHKKEILAEINAMIDDPEFAQDRQEGMTLLHKEFKDTVKSAYDVSFGLVDRLLWYAILGTLIGARLGHVLFYELSFNLEHPLNILMVWNGGLASHGAAVGLLIATYFFYARHKNALPPGGYFAFLDLFTLPVPIAGAFIRVGNFVNQEILGTPSALPWAIIFGRPADGSAVVPRHPVMLYEALAYCAIFAVSFTLWRQKGASYGPGFFSGLFFTLVFSARFLLEFFKVPQTSVVIINGLRMGQVLSIPFIVLGLVLIWRSYVQKYRESVV